LTPHAPSQKGWFWVRPQAHSAARVSRSGPRGCPGQDRRGPAAAPRGHGRWWSDRSVPRIPLPAGGSGGRRSGSGGRPRITQRASRSLTSTGRSCPSQQQPVEALSAVTPAQDRTMPTSGVSLPSENGPSERSDRNAARSSSVNRSRVRLPAGVRRGRRGRAWSSGRCRDPASSPPGRRGSPAAPSRSSAAAWPARPPSRCRSW
jgi:hypothetical protein